MACEDKEPQPDIVGQSPYCTSAEEDVAIDAVTPLGLSAQEVLDRYAAPMVGQLDWTPTGEGYELLLNTGSERTDINVSMTYEGGRIWFVDHEVIIPDGPHFDAAISCPDNLRTDVTLNVTTADGALAESWDAVLVVAEDPQTGEPADPVIGFHVERSSLGGTLAITGIEPTTWMVKGDGLRVLIEFADGGSTGRLQTSVIDYEGFTRMVDVGTWQASAS